MRIISPGWTSRTKVPPTMSRAAVSEATTQPVSRRPSTRGRTPWGSRAAKSVLSVMNTRLKAPTRRGSRRAATSSRGASSRDMSALTRWVSLLESISLLCGTPPAAPSPRLRASRSSSSSVFVRLPLWASASEPRGVEAKVGWAFRQTLEPVVE